LRHISELKGRIFQTPGAGNHHRFHSVLISSLDCSATISSHARMSLKPSTNGVVLGGPADAQTLDRQARSVIIRRKQGSHQVCERSKEDA
jgi:hypothetical protein